MVASNLIVLFYFFIGGLGTYIYSLKIKSNHVWKKYLSYFLIVWSILISLQTSYFIYVPLFLMISFFMFKEHFKYLNNNNYKSFVINLILILGLILNTLISDSKEIIYLYILVLVNDGFAQFGGQLFGKTKFTQISPNKTLEGIFVGMIASIITFYLISNDFNIYYPILISSFAIIGDLSFSYFKRLTKLKDFSNLIPGHGGFSDRFDSLAGASFISLIMVIS